MVTVLIVLGVIVALLLLVGAWLVSIYNKLVKSKNKVENSWSQIDVQLKRRFDLIPNLVETAKGYVAHEKGIFEEFAKARNVFSQASQGGNIEEIANANNMFSSALSRLIAVSEAYPTLKADKHFTELMATLQDTENKIAFSRQFYNDVVLSHNNIIQMFPTNIIANMFNFKSAEFFKAPEEEKEPVKVKF